MGMPNEGGVQLCSWWGMTFLPGNPAVEPKPALPCDSCKTKDDSSPSGQQASLKLLTAMPLLGRWPHGLDPQPHPSLPLTLPSLRASWAVSTPIPMCWPLRAARGQPCSQLGSALLTFQVPWMPLRGEESPRVTFTLFRRITSVVNPSRR